MPTYPSPVEFLIVFTVVFGAGVLTSVGLRQYTDKIRKAGVAGSIPAGRATQH